MGSSGELIHIVGGGFNQIPLVEKARERGLRVLVTDMYENPPARALADHFERIDTTNKESTLRCAKKYNINHIASDMTDVAVPTVAYVAETLGLRGIGYETAIRFTNKFVMRKTLAQKGMGLHLPESEYFERVEDAVSYCNSLKHEISHLVKPVNSQGSKGVAVLEGGRQEIERLVHAAFSESAERGVLIEPFVRGFEYSAETFVHEGKVHNLTVTKKYHYAQNQCLDERNTFLGDVAPELEREIFTVNRKIIEALELPFGNTHAEYKVHDGQVYLIEIAARGAGGSIASKIIPFLTGFDCLGAMLDTLLERPFEISIEDYKNRFAVLKFFNFGPGKIRRIVINPDVIQGCLEFSLILRDGDTIRPIQSSRDRAGYFVVHGEDRSDVLNREQLVEVSVQIEYDDTARNQEGMGAR